MTFFVINLPQKFSFWLFSGSEFSGLSCCGCPPNCIGCLFLFNNYKRLQYLPTKVHGSFVCFENLPMVNFLLKFIQIGKRITEF